MKVNLLPWRDTDRKQKLTQFSRIFLLGIICGSCAWLITYMVINEKLQQVKQDNQKILQEINHQTESLLQSRKTKDQQKQQVSFFQQAKLIRLRQQQALLFFINLPKLMNERSYLVNIKKDEKQITIVGVANEYADIYRLFFGIQQQMNQVQLIKAHKINNQISFTLSSVLQ